MLENYSETDNIEKIKRDPHRHIMHFYYCKIVPVDKTEEDIN
jgi:hypothetical protein